MLLQPRFESEILLPEHKGDQPQHHTGERAEPAEQRRSDDGPSRVL